MLRQTLRNAFALIAKTAKPAAQTPFSTTTPALHISVQELADNPQLEAEHGLGSGSESGPDARSAKVYIPSFTMTLPLSLREASANIAIAPPRYTVSFAKGQMNITSTNPNGTSSSSALALLHWFLVRPPYEQTKMLGESMLKWDHDRNQEVLSVVVDADTSDEKIRDDLVHVLESRMPAANPKLELAIEEPESSSTVPVVRSTF